MIITLSIFYYLFLIVLAFFLLYSFFNIYHLLKFGFSSTTNIIIIVLYLAFASVLIMFAFGFLAQYDWQRPLIQAQTDASL